jgi:hypothetical protein
MTKNNVATMIMPCLHPASLLERSKKQGQKE